MADPLRLLQEVGSVAGALDRADRTFSSAEGGGSPRMGARRPRTPRPLARPARVLLGAIVVGQMALCGFAGGRRAAAATVPALEPTSSPVPSALPAGPGATRSEPESTPPPCIRRDGCPIPAGRSDRAATPARPGTPLLLGLQCEPPVYYGLRHCTVGAVHILVIDPTSPRVRFEAVLAQGYDRDGVFRECRDVQMPEDSTGPGCERRGRYPSELVAHMAGRYPGAVAGFNGDFFDHTSGPVGLFVKNGVRLDGLYGDRDGNEIRRASLSISSAGGVRIGTVDLGELPEPSRPWTWRPDPTTYHSTIGGGPLLIRSGEPVVLHRQCSQEASPRRRDCPRWRKACARKGRRDAANCPSPYEQRARMAVGKTRDGQLVVVATPEEDGLTLPQLVDVLQGLGAAQAMNLDGGRSTQLWHAGHTLVAPGRAVASGMLVFSRLGQPPAAPGELAARPTGPTSIRLAWTDHADDEEGYRIFRNGLHIETLPVDAVSFQDRDLDGGASYTYSVRAFNEFGEAEASHAASATTRPGRGF